MVFVWDKTVSVAAVYQLYIKYDQQKLIVFLLDAKRPVRFPLTPRTYEQTHNPTVVQGGGEEQEPVPWIVFGLRYFEKVIPPIDSLLCRLHD